MHACSRSCVFLLTRTDGKIVYGEMGAVNRPGFDFAFQPDLMGSSQGDDDDVRQIISSTSCACFELVTSEKNSKDETRVLSVLPTLSFGLLEEIFCK